MKLSIAVSVVLVLCSSAHASYELAILHDDTNNTFLRYDPVNRVVLGTFGSQYQGLYGNGHQMALDPTAPGKFLSMDVNGVLRQIDYSNGILTNAYHQGTDNLFPVNFRALNNGNILRVLTSGAAQVLSRSSSTPLYSLLAYSGYTTMDAMQLDNGDFITLERTTNGSNFDWHLFRRDLSGQFLNGAFNVLTNKGSSAIRSITMQNNQIIGVGNTGISLNHIRVPYSAGTFGAQTFFGFSYTIDTSYVSTLANAHSNQVYFVQNSGGSTRFFNMDLNSSVGFSMDNTSLAGRQITSMIMVVAPEPGALVGLGLGALLLMRRKK